MLTIIDTDTSTRNIKYKCKCDCGKEKLILGYNLKSGHTYSCGCKKNLGNKTGHLKSKTKSGRAYFNMKKHHPNEICDEWMGENGIAEFCKWYEANDNGKFLIRINQNEKFSKDNCIISQSKKGVANIKNRKG